MIRRTMDATFLNTVANDPTVRPFIGGDGESVIDLGPQLADPRNVALETEHGGWVLFYLAPGEWCLHTMFLKSGRGRFYRKASAEALRWMFTRTDCTEILTECPDGNPAARMAAVMAGFRERFVRGETSYQAFTIDDWIARDAEALKAGQWFHERIDEARGLHGVDTHPDDEAHNRAAGTAILMMREGQIGKGVAVYNRWARFAGYAQVAQVGPHVVDIGDAVIEIVGPDMNVLAVRRPD